MQIELSVYYSVQDVVQESITVQLDDEWVEYTLVRYLAQNHPGSELEDFIIQRVCID